MATRFLIERTAPTVYLDARGNAVQGFLVLVHLTDYDELHEVRVPNLTPATVEKEINKLLANRDALANLGKTK